MAYTVAINKESVSKVRELVYALSMRVVINDGTNDLLDKTYSIQHNTNQIDMEVLKKELLAAVKADWDKYNAEVSLKNKDAFDVAISDIQQDIEGYINKEKV